MAGFANDVMIADNVNFTGQTGVPGKAATVTINGELLIGSTISPHIKVGSLTSPMSTISIGYSDPNITLDVAGGAYISLSPFIVGTDSHSGYSTIAAGQAAAVAAGATNTTPMNVYIKPKADGTAYSENLTLQPGVNLVGFGRSVTIIGKLSYSSAGSMNVSNLILQTNSDFCLAVTGSAGSVVNLLNNCIINCTNHTGISTTGTAVVRIFDSESDLGTTGIALYSSTSAGSINIYRTLLTNSGNSTTASSSSAGDVTIRHCYSNISFAITSTAALNIENSMIDIQGINTTCVTSAGTGSFILVQSYLTSGSASAVSIGTGTSGVIANCSINSSNTNVLTGAGTLNYGLIVFLGSSSGHNVTTENALATLI